MKVQVINNDGTVVWAFDAQERQDRSGTDWNGKKIPKLWPEWLAY